MASSRRTNNVRAFCAVPDLQLQYLRVRAGELKTEAEPVVGSRSHKIADYTIETILSHEILS